MIKPFFHSATAVLMMLTACNNSGKSPATTNPGARGSYAYDATFLRKQTENVFELSSEDGQSRVLISAEHQGRIMTSTATGDTGISFGWINYNLLDEPLKKKQFNPVGGEERIWLGPEGGQFALYFKPKDSFNFDNWQVPPVLDTEPFTVRSFDESHLVFSKKATLVNHSGTNFDITIDRSITLLNARQASTWFTNPIPKDIAFVGYETVNSVTNDGATDWKESSGLLSIWLLGMFTPTPSTYVIIPFASSPIAAPAGDTTHATSRGLISDNYFGPIPSDRLRVQDSILYFSCDGKYRSKIGLSPRIAKPIAGSFDYSRNILTIVIPQVSPSAPYVNSKWEMQQEPYKGDVINSYNDGPLADGSQMGPFYEIESSSPALALKRGEKGTYRQATFHFQGDYSGLKQLALDLLGADLDKVRP